MKRRLLLSSFMAIGAVLINIVAVVGLRETCTTLTTSLKFDLLVAVSTFPFYWGVFYFWEGLK